MFNTPLALHGGQNQIRFKQGGEDADVDFFCHLIAEAGSLILLLPDLGISRDMPNVFYRLYPVPEDKRGDNDWFKSITYVSHPFDPLLTVSACHPDLFVLEPVPNKSGRGDHLIIGRLADDGVSGVPDPDRARAELSRAVTAAGSRIQYATKPEPVPVLLVTDIGRHVDDTLALLALAQYQAEGRIRLAGVVTTGGKAEDRARLARFWLRKLGMRDIDVQVAACSAAGEEKDVCAFPLADPPVPTYDQAAIYEVGCLEPPGIVQETPQFPDSFGTV